VRDGKAEASADPGARILVVATVRPGRSTPRRLRLVAEITTERSASSPVPVHVPLWGWLAVGLLLAIVYAVGYDQGTLLEPLLGKLSSTNNYLHELFHDARHLLGFPCH
jgi:hypothetical protein